MVGNMLKSAAHAPDTWLLQDDSARGLSVRLRFPVRYVFRLGKNAFESWQYPVSDEQAHLPKPVSWSDSVAGLRIVAWVAWLSRAG